MIGYLDGTVKAVHKNYLVVLTQGNVGYKVNVTPPVLLSTEVGKPVQLYIHTHVREDQLALYGFSTLGELDFFELLLTVSGIGPRMAISILSLGDLEMIKSGIVNEDPLVFTKVSGVGRKTAERLIVELKEKIGVAAETKEDLRKLSREHADVLDVLMALGYSQQEAREALGAIPKDITETNDRVREALRALAKQ